MSFSDLVERLRAGDERTASRVISLIEEGAPESGRLLAEIFAVTGGARVVGITGPPGAGKSTLVRSLISVYRRRNLSVAVLAIDPTSPFSGGALLGDRIRMGGHAADREVFIRSLASRGHPGGLAAAAHGAVRVLDAMGFDRILVETVGVGQNEIAVSFATDCTVLVLVPGAGDAIQTMKSGVMEIANIFVVNKSDRPGADQVRQDIMMMQSLRGGERAVVMTRAERGEGAESVIAAIEAYLARSEEGGQLAHRRGEQLESEMMDLVGRGAQKAVLDQNGQAERTALVQAIVRRELDPAAAAARMLHSIRSAVP